MRAKSSGIQTPSDKAEGDTKFGHVEFLSQWVETVCQSAADERQIGRQNREIVFTIVSLTLLFCLLSVDRFSIQSPTYRLTGCIGNHQSVTSDF